MHRDIPTSQSSHSPAPSTVETQAAPAAGPSPAALTNVESGGDPISSARVFARIGADAAALGVAPDRVQRVAEVLGLDDAAAIERPAAQLHALYDALRRSRIAGCTEIIARVPSQANALCGVLDLRPVAGAHGFAGQRLDVALSRTAQAIAAEGAAGLSPDYLAEEVARHLEGFFERIYASRWFRAVYDKTITRGQYVYTLSNMHQFVRFTTRILGRCVATAEDPTLRVHFIRHLQEEVNHELIIERDLAAMGEDVDYVRDHMAPNLATRQFMAAQESAIAFHRDPVLLMAAPLAAEGISGHLDQAFLDALHEVASGWGVADPTRITRFYSSHMDFDGGDDGHWEGTVRMLAAHLTDETKLARFLSVLAATTHAMERCYDSWIDDVRFG